MSCAVSLIFPADFRNHGMDLSAKSVRMNVFLKQDMAKKIKKVETPIDQRETFVSLQKNFADSEISVEEKLKTLYALQEADSAIDRIVQLRGELPSEVEALEDEISDLKARSAELVAVIDEFNRAIGEEAEHRRVRERHRKVPEAAGEHLQQP